MTSAPATAQEADRVPRWQFLVRVLQENGPQTTGALGHIYGIGENIRGIRREANASLLREGSSLRVVSRRTKTEDGSRPPWRTYQLVDAKTVKREPDYMDIIAEAKDLDRQWLDAIARDDAREAAVAPHVARTDRYLELLEERERRQAELAASKPKELWDV